MALLKIQYPPSNPFGVTTSSRLSSEVWYSGYSPYFVLRIDAIGRSTPGAQY